ncbi:hypothetical protein [Bdellovibrio bacteriovorus]|uniref:hypothetical protein n=1 Tax=Bdellovibrio TaxID=958 RepID=UPI0035A87C03
MKRVFGRITAAILITSTLGACSPEPHSAQENGSVRVLAPMSNSKGTYSLDVMELHGIEDLQTMAGRFVRFFMSPRIINSRLDGQSPKTRFIRNKQGEYIPANEITQQLVTVYAHMQRLAELDEELGASGVNKWPRDIGVAVKVKGGVRNNAFYDGATDSMLFVPYTQNGLPIAINGGILAHEHFHSLFYKLVLPESPYKGSVHDREEILKITDVQEDLSTSTRQRLDVLPIESHMRMDEGTLHFYYHMAITRGLNEGLADFWGWMYTGDPDFIAQSLPGEKNARSLKVTDETSVNSLPSPEALQRSLKIFYNSGDNKKMKEYSIGFAYSLATQYSRFLKRLTDIYAKDRGVEPLQARKEIAKVLIKTLPKIKSSFEGLSEDYYTSVQFVESLIEQLGELKENECAFLAQVMTNSVEVSNEKFVCKSNKIEKEQIVDPATPSTTEAPVKTAEVPQGEAK